MFVRIFVEQPGQTIHIRIGFYVSISIRDRSPKEKQYINFIIVYHSTNRSVGVASGMNYLANMNIVHCDLAARNLVS